MTWICYDERIILEKVFTAEIENRLPYQSKAGWLKTCAVRGLVEPMTVYFGNARVDGWQLTHAGRIAYCEWASRQPQPAMNDCGEGK